MELDSVDWGRIVCRKGRDLWNDPKCGSCSQTFICLQATGQNIDDWIEHKEGLKAAADLAEHFAANPTHLSKKAGE